MFPLNASGVPNGQTRILPHQGARQYPPGVFFDPSGSLLVYLSIWPEIS